MFTWLNKQGVQSDRGFVVQVVGRFLVEYRELGKTVSVEVEGCFFDGKAHVSISPTAFERWDGDPEWALLPSDKQDEILANFTEAMEFQGVEVHVEPEE
jgi:hypothetical protein